MAATTEIAPISIFAQWAGLAGWSKCAQKRPGTSVPRSPLVLPVLNHHPSGHYNRGIARIYLLLAEELCQGVNRRSYAARGWACAR